MEERLSVITPTRTARRVAASRHGAMTPKGLTAPAGRPPGRRGLGSARLRALAPEGEEGFTLVELLVVVLMLVALVGIAVPTFVGQQDRAERAAVQSELRTAAIALESFRARNGVYGVGALDTPEFGFVRSVEVATFYEAADFGTDSYCVRAWYDPVTPGQIRTVVKADADARAQWAITAQGMVYVADAVNARSCP